MDIFIPIDYYVNLSYCLGWILGFLLLLFRIIFMGFGVFDIKEVNISHLIYTISFLFGS
jgi:hypothetical protein